jgi:hypothetical protein
MTSTARRPYAFLKWARLVTASGALILGALGYVQPITGSAWPVWASIALLVAFCIISLGQWLLDRLQERRAAEEFYEQEVTEVFRPNASARLLRFFTDNAGNKCVAIVLEHEPIAKSLNLWEGGYHAPPITLVVKGNIVVFLHSGYEKAEDYTNESPVYQVRYFPRKP